MRNITPKTWFEDGICMISGYYSDLANFAPPLSEMLDELEDSYRIGSSDKNLDTLEKSNYLNSNQKELAKVLRHQILTLSREKWNPEAFDNDPEWQAMRETAQQLKRELNIVPYYKQDWWQERSKK